MQVSHVEKNMVEQSSTGPNSQSIGSREYLNHSLGLTLSTPSLVYPYLLAILSQSAFEFQKI